MRQEAAKFAPDVVYVDTYHLFSGPDGGYSRSLPDKNGNDVEMRISDGIHFTVDGAQYLSDAVWKLLEQALAHHASRPTRASPSTTRSRRAATTTCPASAATGRRTRRTRTRRIRRTTTPSTSSVSSKTGTTIGRHPDHGGHGHDDRPFDDTDHRAAHDDTDDHAAHDADDGAAPACHEQTGRASDLVRDGRVARRLVACPDARRARRRPPPRSTSPKAVVDDRGPCAWPSVERQRQDLGRRARPDTRCSPTTSRTRRPPSRARGSCAATASTARSSRCWRAPYVADAVHDVATRVLGRERGVGTSSRDALAGAMPFVAEHRDPAFLEALADQCVKHGTGPTHLSDDFELVAETFRRFADDKIRPAAEHVHRTNADVPEDIISGLAELGGFGLSRARGIRRLRDRRRVRLHGHGRRDRGALARFTRHRRLARSPGPRSSRAPSSPAAPRSRSRRGCRGSRAASSWSASW